MTPDLSLLSGFARGELLSLHVRDTCLHSGSWLLSGLVNRLRVEIQGLGFSQGVHGQAPMGFKAKGLRFKF